MSNISIEDIKDQIRILEETAVSGESDAFALRALRELLECRNACRAAMLQVKTESVREKVLRAQMESIITDLNLPDGASLVDITNEIFRLQGEGAAKYCRSNEKLQE